MIGDGGGGVRRDEDEEEEEEEEVNGWTSGGMRMEVCLPLSKRCI